MSAPAYRWLCHKCGLPNEPHTETCTSCGFSAVASAEQIDRSHPDYQPLHHDTARAERYNHIGLFFPEGILAAILVLVAPFWSIQLALTGHVGTACALVAGVGLAVYAFVQFMRSNHNYLAYFAMIAALALALLIHSATR